MNNKLPKKVIEAIEDLCDDTEAQIGCAEPDVDALNLKRIRTIRAYLNTINSMQKTCANCKYVQLLRYPDGISRVMCFGKTQLTPISDKFDICDNWTERNDK